MAERVHFLTPEGRVKLVKDAWRGVRDLLDILAADLHGRYPKR